ncbi:MAG: hypothetical protein UW43_C0007G0012 [Candidatus Yanofskybacteria bacterium GW2011_GWA1_44_21]|uniref:Uncharacterized protein n=2 Tax=Candidatus Yanofskyibacteriota TaxID=1752733 RepID=A0A1F8GZR7_9BACT|nr:MAG: hypothetical protein UW43_C0007G0012 [Candidatus Yanofskybacteria bacterium GW2011_GWA1_44_21]KKT89988.1 MAG: hypothetical protein UW90_C0009G0012 [Candidatus Yanofskybacteria bacterium GW2011_GWB1_45_11]OGN14722.1 MAG: hypothetical protein A3C01_02175 [Candidatus Yanofskybacteria bacterium RIFCSPHIGHO2_02_FULL_44_36b]OGN18320.1 MAG: hypothetical protein A3F50_00225 [Candidatus Yanofskybacteria bacterium RIFCSPHIGHO2_12_FULL_44_29b]OGN30897.1 MAG: hypothetical protein A3I96_01280 [Candi
MSKQTIVWVIVIAVAGYGIWMVTKNNGSIGPTGDNVSPSPSVSGSSVSSGTKSSTKTTGGGTASGTNVSYSDILSQYKTKTIQFNAQCQATPGQMALKTGEKILLDNRSSDTKTLKLDADTYTLAGYSWKVVTVKTSKALPYMMGIDCRSAGGVTENTATINLQANISDGI